MAGSFGRINYSLRPNKSAERKILMDSLGCLSEAFNFIDYRYIGFGSLWFVDFVLLHKLIGVTDMHSIESEMHYENRVRFNKPLGCINVHMGRSEDILPKLVESDRRSILWLDYDGILESALKGGDIERVVSDVPSGSLLLVTVNADHIQLKDKNFNGQELTPSEYLESFCEEYLPAEYESKLTKNQFPKLVGEVILNAMKSTALDSRSDVRFYPLWNICYADGVKMVTAGGILLNAEDFKNFERLNISQKNPFMSLDSSQKDLDLPILTLKEKMHLDSKLPSVAGLKLRDIEFTMAQKDLDTYQSLYKYFPLYGEMSVF
jgi:hypothetical protein